MSRRSNLHVVPHNGGWAVRREGAARVSSTHATQRAAEGAARNTARREQGEVFTHRPNGQIRDRDSYGSDPCPPQDAQH
jgi:uncharacterized protein DUF2188